MIIKFHSIDLHNFMSFGDSHLDLDNRGYTLIRGINNCKKDLAMSNGSGKSSIWSAICWALTGETIQGISKNISNKDTDGGCRVTLSFSIDKDNYVITRYKDDKKLGTNLKILLNGEDKSGKGVRESEAILNQYIPELNSSLIGSVIILGQGLPHKFSDNTPSGRKEVLEKLSKSDFMIDDIKIRLNNRQSDLVRELYDIDKNIIENSTELKIVKGNLEQVQNELNSIPNISTLETTIILLEGELKNYDDDLKSIKETQIATQAECNLIREEYSKLGDEHSAYLTELNKVYNLTSKKLLTDKSNLKSELSVLSSEINRLKNIKDVCPTCGQKLPNVVKPDTTEHEKKAALLTESINKIDSSIEDEDAKYSSTLKEEDKKYNSKISGIKLKLDQYNLDLAEIQKSIGSLEKNRNIVNTQYQLNLKERDDYFKYKKEREIKLKSFDERISALNLILEDLNSKRKDIEYRQNIINQITTLVKRDFRGILLSNIIDFLNSKGKEYSKDIFNTEEFELSLDGNNLNISYGGKLYENLSGGEKQKIDLITQFALRDMLCQYMDFRSNILVLDEILDNIDVVGCQRVIDLISTKIKDVDSLFLISHKADELNIPYDSEIIVEKDKKGISSIRG